MSTQDYVNPNERERLEAAAAAVRGKPASQSAKQDVIYVPRKRARWALVTVFTLAGLAGAGVVWSKREIDYNFSDKGKLDTEIVEASATRCKGFDDDYRARLRNTLRRISKESLELMKKSDVTICMNREMMKTEFLMAAYFPDRRMIVLRDDGARFTPWKFKSFVNGHVPNTINLLATFFDYVSIRPEIAYASAYDVKTEPRIEWWYPVKKTNTDRAPSAEMR